MGEMASFENPPDDTKTAGNIERSPEELEKLEQQILGYQEYILNVCRIFLHNKNESEARDLAHDSLSQAILKAKTFRGEADLKSWLYRITWNNCVQSKRRGGKSKRGFDEVSVYDLTKEELMQKVVDAESGVEGGLILDEIKEAVEKLPETYMKTAKLFLKGYTAKEIADELGITLTNAKTRIHRVRLALQKALKDYAVRN